MGVSGLLPLLKSIHKPCSLKKFSGKTIGVDAYGWLHRGTIACAIELAQGKPTAKWINFVMGRVRMLAHFGVKPYLVFDGDYLPSKSGTEKDRAARRRDSRRSGLELLRLGKTSQAQLELQKSIDVTPDMARQLIEELKSANIDYVVAPYEADAQLAYLERIGVIDAVLSEDSDLLVFGTQCLLTKLDQYGDCIMINREDFTACREISLVGWTDADFRLMAILSGCDYLSSIDKMGLKTAYRLVRKHKTVDRLLRAVQFDGKMKVPPGYSDAFARAEATFLYQWVYCPKAKGLVNFSEPAAEVNLDEFPCIGKFVESDLATGVARGDLHPHTKLPIVVPSAARPALRNPVVMSTPNLKQHKPIDSFFKPYRTPLAELDPNSFTPSPSQQQLLRQLPASWSADPVARRPLLARSGTSVTASAPQRLRRSATDMAPPPVQSPKRQRLCSDGFYSVPMNMSSRIEAGSSRFFSSKPSPCTSRGKNKDRSAANEFNLWSDDSVEEAMSQLSEQNDAPRTKSSRKLSVFKDSAIQIESASRVRPASPTTPSITRPSVSAAETQQQPSSPCEETIFSSGLAANVELLRFRYSAPKEVETSTAPESTETSIPCSSPMRPDNDDGDSDKQNESRNSGGGACASHTTEFNEADWQAAESRSLDSLADSSSGSSSSRLLLGQYRHNVGEAKLRGSEDLLVPDSEGEDEEVVESSSSPAFRFSLAKFAFKG